MSNVIARGLDTIREPYPELYEALQSIVKGINQTAQVSGVGSNGPAPMPANSGMLTVTQQNGIYDAAIVDNNPLRGEEYHIEFDTQPSFATARLVKDGGPGRYYRANLGSMGSTYWRYYKQSKGSNPSPYIYHGGSVPKAVTSTAGATGPAPGVPNGSGSSTRSGHGWGLIGPGSAQ